MPRVTATMLDLSELPPAQRREVRDFVDFLRSKREVARKPVAKHFAKLIDEPLTVDSLHIPSRESLHVR